MNWSSVVVEIRGTVVPAARDDKRRASQALLVALLLALVPRPAGAAEGGGSHYLPGTMGDFAMAVIGPPGFYLRNDLVYVNADIGGVSLGKFVLDEVEQQVWVNIVKGIYMADWGILGSRFGAVVSLPLVLDAELSGTLAAPPVSRSGSRDGIGDMSFTSFLNWSRGDFHTNLGLNVYAPTGFYDEDEIINLGRNYWTFDPTATFTWLHAERGHEVSFITGTMFNTENDATEYQTGDEFHLGFNVAQHFSPRFAVGFIGYYYEQLTDDDGPTLDQLQALGRASGGFQGEAIGLGGAVKVTPHLLGRDVNLILKYLNDVHTQNRFNGYSVFLSVAFGF